MTQPEQKRPQKGKSMRCIVKDCENHKHEGLFIGNLCSPCYTYITKLEGRYSQAYRNTQHTWAGLTPEEIDEIEKETWDEDHKSWGIHDFAKAIEAKLKAKNSL